VVAIIGAFGVALPEPLAATPGAPGKTAAPLGVTTAFDSVEAGGATDGDGVMPDDDACGVESADADTCPYVTVTVTGP
jgi:hypothetical protein